jgi:hypothetical protein
MANPMREEEEIYKQIREQNVTIHPLVWELIEHHISNDLHIIFMILGSTILLDGKSFSKENAESIMDHTKAIRDFLIKLKKETRTHG